MTTQRCPECKAVISKTLHAPTCPQRPKQDAAQLKVWRDLGIDPRRGLG
jgi:hypothetical protein